MRADLQSDEDDWRATGHGGYFLEVQDCAAARLVDQNETMWNYGSGISKLPGTRARGARRLAMYAVIGAAAVMMACFASAGRGEQHGPTETAARQWTELMENADLCATQVVKLPDCIAKAPRKLPRNSPYVLHGKEVPWKTIKQVVSTNPKLVQRRALRHFARTRHALDSIEGKEVIADEAVKQSQRRIEAARKRINSLLAKMHPPPPGGPPHVAPVAKPTLTSYADQTPAPPPSMNTAAQALMTAMATTMQAEQEEIESLRRRVREVKAQPHPHVRSHLKASSLHFSTKPRVNATAWEELHPPLFCKAECKSEAHWKVPREENQCIRACAVKHGTHQSTAVRPSKTFTSKHASHLEGFQDISAIAAKVAQLISGTKVGKLKRADPRAVEDAKLQAAAEKLVEAKERAMISLEKAEQKHLQAMQTWSKGLETGGLHTLGLHAYGVDRAMARAKRDASRDVRFPLDVVPHKEHLTGIEETRQLEKAGVSKADIVGAFHFPLKRSVGRFDVTERVRRESGAHDFQLRNSVKNTGTRGVFGESFGGKGEHHASVTDMRAEAKVGTIAHATRVKARSAVDSIINSGPRHRLDGPGSVRGDGRRGRSKGHIKIEVFPGSSRPLRARVDPTSIKFWKELDAGGVDVGRGARTSATANQRILEQGTG